MMRLILLTGLLLLTGCSHVFYQPSKEQFLSPTQFKIPYEDVWFDAKDRTRLHGWFFRTPHARPKGTIVQFHGNAQNISTHFLSLIWIVGEGYNLLSFDYRGYGQSQGVPGQKGVYLDALAAMDKGRELNEHNGGGKFVLYGQSLGGNICARSLSDYADKSIVDLLVLDSTFSSYQGIAFDKLTDRWFLWPLSPFAFVLVSDEYAAEKVLSKLLLPTMVVVGQKDQIVPQKFGKKIFKELGSKQKWLWKLPEGQHIDVFHHEKGKYREDFLKFLEALPKKKQ